MKWELTGELVGWAVLMSAMGEVLLGKSPVGGSSVVHPRLCVVCSSFRPPYPPGCLKSREQKVNSPASTALPSDGAAEEAWPLLPAVSCKPPPCLLSGWLVGLWWGAAAGQAPDTRAWALSSHHLTVNSPLPSLSSPSSDPSSCSSKTSKGPSST